LYYLSLELLILYIYILLVNTVNYFQEWLVSYCLVIYFQNVKSYNAGILTALSNRIAGLGANFEFDLKKIIALSTLSQLGLIIRCLSIHIPYTTSCLNVANLALCGMPFLAGFYSKDLILEIVSLSYVNIFSFFLFFFSTGLTVCYSFRLVYYSLTGDFNTSSLHCLNDE
ncbi:unnamed protein product, partial [Diamesa hyperborea]